MKTVIYVLGFLFISFLFFLVLRGILVKPKKKRIIIAANEGHFNNQCKIEKVSCNTDADCLEKCTEAQEGEEMICQAIPPINNLTDKQKSLLNTGEGPNKYCIPASAIASMKTCNVAHGGIPIFSGWSGIANHMEFDCMCAYPEWANSRVCDSNTGACTTSCSLNPDICKGGKFNWDLTKKVQPPIAELCECAAGDTMVIDNAGLPRCVPEGIQHFYDDLDITSGVRGGYEMKYVDGVPMTKINPNLACQSCQCCTGSKCDCSKCENMYTPCPTGCCPLEKGVCCGDYCCPPNYTCDNVNGRCVRKCCPDVNGGCKPGCCDTDTTCPGGCCPIKDGVCCGDGTTCCPPNFPNCDTVNKVCNPNITPLLKQNCKVGDDNTQCPNGCCPYTDGVCCGDFCCPPEYPICDVTNKVCKMYH